MSWASQYAKALKRQQVAEFEEKVVPMLLGYYGIQDLWPRQLQHGRHRRPRTLRYTLRRFHETFPTFPVALYVPENRHTAKLYSMARLFEDFESLPLFREFRAKRDSYKHFAFVGMIINWQFAGRPWVLHDHGLGPPGAFLMAFRRVDEAPPLYLQSLPNFLKLVAWEPEQTNRADSSSTIHDHATDT
jgi:hypothetical protein